MAFFILRAGRRTAGEGTGAHLSRPVLERVLGRPKNFDEESREHYAALYARPDAMHAGFEQFKAFDQDASDNKAFVTAGKLTMPVLAIGGEKSFGPMMATVMHAAATNVTEAIVPNSGHWVMEENPTATIKLITDFLAITLKSALQNLSVKLERHCLGPKTPCLHRV